MIQKDRFVHINVSLLLLGLAVVCVGIALSLSASPAWAQSTSAGSVSGQVTDPQKAVVPGAEVTLLDTATNASRTAITNETGRYIFVNVQPGIYDISVSITGFSTAKMSAQKVTVGQDLTVNFTLKVGGISETVEVLAAAGAQLQTTTATVGSTIAGSFVLLLPNLSRDAYALQTLNVGITPTGQVAGTQTDQNTYMVDGTNVTDDNSGNLSYNALPNMGSLATTGVIPTPVESIEEFKIGTSNQTADFANSSGSQIQMITKRGTNQLHGSLYDYYFGSNVGAANNWKNNHTKYGSLPYTPLPATHYNRFGASAGGPLSPDWLGGKWYIFGNFEGYRFPNATTNERAVPSDLMRHGVIQVQASNGTYVPFNLNPTPVTVNGVTYQPATCGANNTPCDPRGIGLNPIVNQLWSKYMPQGNDQQFTSGNGDGRNILGYLTPIKLPQSSNFFVGRIDHDFGSKWHFMSAYRYYKYTANGDSQVDMGGLLGGTLGQAKSVYTTPSQPWSLVFGLTTTVTNHLTNDVHLAYMRELWAYGSAMAPPQLPGLAGALEIGGESYYSLQPYNVDNQDVRAREWNGHDYQLRDDLTYLHGDHLFQFGGSYQRNFDQMYRTDNGAGIMAALVYQIYDTGINIGSNYIPAGLPSGSQTTWKHLYAEVLGLVNSPQALFTRKLPDLTLNPIGTPMFPQGVIPYYNLYFTDTWHVRPRFTLSYGIGYMLEMPPYELNGKQVITTDITGEALHIPTYLAQKKAAALNGQIYNPTIGMELVRNAGGGMKYPYNPFYAGFSPRIAAAWNPSFGNGILGKIFGDGDTVFRGGYSRIYGRLNGVKQIMSLVNNTGVGQPINCLGASISGGCLGTNGTDPTTAFRIGTDGMTAPMPTLTTTLLQPYFPGVGANPMAGDGAGIDPDFKPNRSDQVTLSIQRAFSHKLTLELGYIGRKIRNEFMPVNLDAVPYMLTLNGQRFDKAWANLYQTVSSGGTIQTQPWFESAMGGASSPYCTGYASCTAAVAAKQVTNINGTRVYDFWSVLSKDASWTLGRTQPSSTPGQQVTSLIQYSSSGYGNYNAGYVSFTANDWHGLGARSNFTWGRALGTGFQTQSSTQVTVLDAWDFHANYGPQAFDYKFIYNLSMTYQPPYFKSQTGLLGRMLGGWAIAPLFTARTGVPLRVTTSSGNAGAFGEIYSGSGSSNNEGAVLLGPFTGGNSANYNVTVASGAGVNGNASTGGSGINMFEDPNAIKAEFRRLILGLDHDGGGTGVVRGFGTWNLDMTLSKDFRAKERVGATLMFQFTNILNHFQPSNPTLNIDSPSSFGVVTAQANTPRQMQFGLRIRF
jgi:hypothetical protein